MAQKALAKKKYERKEKNHQKLKFGIFISYAVREC
jgi:hypothetical protein